MAPLEYQDLVLLAEDIATDEGGALESFTVRVFDSPVGQDRGKERVRVPSRLRAELTALGARLLDFDAARQVGTGRMLGEMLLPPRARALFRRSLDRLSHGQALRLRLRLDDALTPLPWEYIWLPDEDRSPDGAGAFVALMARVSIARHEALPIPADSTAAPERRRVVVAAASPTPHERFPRLEALAEERAAVESALTEVAGIEMELLPFQPGSGDSSGSGTTPRHVLDAVLKSRADVFHFMGHGDRDPGTGEPRLIFADARNRAVPVLGTIFAELLEQSRIRLVVLNACESGARTGVGWGSIAVALLRARIPAVVAMQSRIGDGLGGRFSSALYRALAGGRSIDEAVFHGRAAIRAAAQGGTPHARDWGVPVLYLRSAGGVLFDPVRDPEAVRLAEEAGAQFVGQDVGRVEAGGHLVGVLADESGERVVVEQEVDTVDGLVVGGVVFENRGGTLRVVQKIGTVRAGAGVTGAVIGKRRPGAVAPMEAYDLLERLLRGQNPGAGGADAP